MHSYQLRIDGEEIPDRLVKVALGLVGGELRIEGDALLAEDKSLIRGILDRHREGSLASIEVFPTESNYYWHGTHRIKQVKIEVFGVERLNLHYIVVAQMQ